MIADLTLSYFGPEGYRVIRSPTLHDLKDAFNVFEPQKGRTEVFLQWQKNHFIVGIDESGEHYIARYFLSWPEVCICIKTRSESDRDQEIHFIAPNGEGYTFPEKYLLTREEAFEIAQYYFMHGTAPTDPLYTTEDFIP